MDCVEEVEMSRQQARAFTAVLALPPDVRVDQTDPVVGQELEPRFATRFCVLPSVPVLPLSPDGADGQGASGRVVSSPCRSDSLSSQPSPAWSPFA